MTVLPYTGLSDIPEVLAAALTAAAPVSNLMQSAGHRFYLVGGVVRDAYAERAPAGWAANAARWN